MKYADIFAWTGGHNSAPSVSSRTQAISNGKKVRSSHRRCPQIHIRLVGVATRLIECANRRRPGKLIEGTGRERPMLDHTTAKQRSTPSWCGDDDTKHKTETFVQDYRKRAHLVETTSVSFSFIGQGDGWIFHKHSCFFRGSTRTSASILEHCRPPRNPRKDPTRRRPDIFLCGAH
jgi:hypothetical protein